MTTRRGSAEAYGGQSNTRLRLAFVAGGSGQANQTGCSTKPPDALLIALVKALAVKAAGEDHAKAATEAASCNLKEP